MSRRLRDYQQHAVDETERRQADGHLSQAGVAATGLGKSTIGGQWIVNHVRRHGAGARAFIAAHRSELVDQLAATVREIADDIPVGIVGGKVHEPDRPITVCMTPTVGGKRGARRREHLENWGRPTAVLYDEFHHAAAPGAQEFLSWAGAGGPGELSEGDSRYREPTIPLLGVTATLGRSDRYGLGDLVGPDDVAFDYGIAFGVAGGHLVTPRGKVVVAEHLDLSKVPTSKGDYQEKRLGEIVIQDAPQIVQAWCDHGEDRTTVGFTPNVASCTVLRDAFLDHRCARHPSGVAAEMVTGDTSLPDRGTAGSWATRPSGIYGRLATGVTRVLVSVMVTTEGWDCPPVSCVLQCRPTKLWTLYVQMVGRGLRTIDKALAAWLGWRLPEGGKVDCKVIDVVGTSRTQKLVSVFDLYPTAEVDTSALGQAPEPAGGSAPAKGPRRLVGPAIYEDVELLLADEKAAWLVTDSGHPFLMSGDRVAVIFAEADGLHYRVAALNRRGRLDAELLGQRLGLGQAQEIAQRWAIRRSPYLANPNAAWRTNSARPGFRERREATRLGIESPDTYTGRELSELIETTEMSQRLDPLGPGARRTS